MTHALSRTIPCTHRWPTPCPGRSLAPTDDPRLVPDDPVHSPMNQASSRMIPGTHRYPEPSPRSQSPSVASSHVHAVSCSSADATSCRAAGNKHAHTCTHTGVCTHWLMHGDAAHMQARTCTHTCTRTCKHTHTAALALAFAHSQLWGHFINMSGSIAAGGWQVTDSGLARLRV